MRRLAALSAAMLITVGCTGDDTAVNTKATLVDALRNLLATKSYTQTITLQSDTASLVALGDGDINEETAQTILDSSIVSSATQADNPEDAVSEAVVNIGGDSAVEVRFVEGDLYFRADVRGLIDTFGGDPAEVDMLVAQARRQRGFEWVEPAAAGEWIVVRDALDLAQQFGGSTVSPTQQKELVDDLLRTVEQNATVTDEGEDDPGQHLRAALPMRETVRDLLESLGAGGAFGMPGGASLDQELEDIPNEELLLDFWVSDETVRQIGFDFTQFERMAAATGEEFPEGVEELTFLIAIEEAEVTVEPIADAVELDPTALTQALSGLMTGGFGGGGGGESFDCSMLKGSPPEVIELYAEECPELQK